MFLHQTDCACFYFGEYLFVMFIAPFSQDLEPSQNPGRFSLTTIHSKTGAKNCFPLPKVDHDSSTKHEYTKLRVSITQTSNNSSLHKCQRR
jgi:hypothetical protein